MVTSLRRFSENEVAQKGLKIIKSYEKHNFFSGREDRYIIILMACGQKRTKVKNPPRHGRIRTYSQIQ